MKELRTRLLSTASHDAILCGRLEAKRRGHDWDRRPPPAGVDLRVVDDLEG